jgi:hypothetical protein
MKVYVVFLAAASLVAASARFDGSQARAAAQPTCAASTGGTSDRADSPPCSEADPALDAAMKALCDEQGWGHWYFQGRCLTNAETLELSTEDAQGIIGAYFRVVF